jgi:hypothetical protein
MVWREDYGHHTPYGNQVVCHDVLNWLTKESPEPRNAQAGIHPSGGTQNLRCFGKSRPGVY